MYISKKNNKKYSPVSAVYLHIPFCRSICPFCSFAVCKDNGNLHDKYIKGMLKEMIIHSKILEEKKQKVSEEKKLSGQKFLESIYLGGGTPSRLSIPEVSELLTNVRAHFPWSSQIEITFEMNPEDVIPEYLNDLVKIGVNRLSLGGQSFQTSTLRKLGRCHKVSELRRACKAIVNSPLNNWNIDLMFGIPEQSNAKFKEDVEEALSYKPPHISLYGLEIHERTPFGQNAKIRKWVTEHQEQYEKMYLWATDRLEKAGLLQYEVSNFSKKGNEGRNNLLVWSGQDYLGFGAGAHSFKEQTRRGNNRSIKSYLNYLEKQTLPTEFEEQLTTTQLATEFLMLGLRRSEGVNLDNWLNRFGLYWGTQEEKYVHSLCEQGYAIRKGSSLCLTPKGMLIADRITVQLMPSDS